MLLKIILFIYFAESLNNFKFQHIILTKKFSKIARFRMTMYETYQSNLNKAKIITTIKVILNN